MATAVPPPNPPAWTEEQFIAAIDHGLQKEALRRVTELLSALRQAKTATQLWEMQGELLKSILWAQEYKSRSKRYLERSKKGKLVPEDPQSGSWELEHRIASRVERQIRSVGDCLAWKVLNCRRDVFYVLSQNQNPGSMYGKTGLDAELERADAHWAKGHFVLMNDLTQSVRIGDLIVFTRRGPQLSEIKAGGRQRSEQRQRIRNALQTLNRERPLNIAGQPHEIFRAKTQLATRMDALGTALTESKVSGFGSVVIEPGRLVVAASLAPTQPTASDDVVSIEKAKESASIGPKQHVLQTIWSWHAWDYQSPMVTGAPFGAFPLEPAQCAELTCGYSTYRVYLKTDVLDRELRAVGFDTRWSLPAGDITDYNKTVLTVIRRTAHGRRGVTISGSAFYQCLYELMEPRRYAEGVREMFDWSAMEFPGQPMAGKDRLLVGRGTMAFGNEKAVWFKKPQKRG
jgi:hypothetical protein